MIDKKQEAPAACDTTGAAGKTGDTSTLPQPGPNVKWYAQRGARLIALDGKRPLARAWTTAAPLSPDELARHIAAGGNLGWALGPCDLVIDIDPRNGGNDGLRTLAADQLAATGETFRSRYPVVITGGGGRHIYMRLPAPVNRRKTLPRYGAGVEFLTAGQQVLIVGDVHPTTRRPYTWDTGSAHAAAPVPLAPQWLIDAIARPPRDLEAPTAAAGATDGTAPAGQWTAEQLAAALEALPAADFADHDRWFSIMCAAHDATAGAGLDAFLSWCASDPDFATDEHQREIVTRWRSLRAGVPGNATIATLIAELRARGADVPGDTRADRIAALPDLDPLDEPAAAPVIIDGAAGDVVARVREPLPTLGPEAAAALFRGCVYVRSEHAIRMPDGYMIGPEQFKVHFGGREFVIGVRMTRNGPAPITTGDAWKAFAHNAFFSIPMVQDTEFFPLRAPGEIAEGKVNTWFPAFGKRAPDGDPAPFLDLVQRLVPDERERGILLDYMAACLQLHGRKFQWCVVLTGVEGNGKSFLFDKVLTSAIGDRYVAKVQGHDLDSKFNGWLDRRLFAHIPDLKVGQRHDVAEILKPLITDQLIAIQRKGVDVDTRRQCCNFAITSNHEDAILVTANDRRFCVIQTAQQTVADRDRDGLTAEFFAALHRWFDDEGGAAAVNDWLWSREIAINVFGSAPRTAGREAAKTATLSGVEQEILEGVETGATWAADEMIDATEAREAISKRVGFKITPRKFSVHLERLGYHPHPNASRGRVWIDNSDHKIYILQGSKYEKYQPEEISKAFDDKNIINIHTFPALKKDVIPF